MASPPASRALSYDDLIRLLWPGGLDPDTRAAVDAMAAGRSLSDPSTLRRLLGAVEQQLHPSPVTVRFGGADTTLVRVGAVELVVDAADRSVGALMAGGSYEPHMTAVFESHVAPGAHVVDVGANVGYFTLLAARLAGPTGRVTSFEPNPENVRLLLASLSRAPEGAPVEVLPVGLSDRRGAALFSTHVGSNGGLRPDLDPLAAASVIATFRLDDLVEGVDLLKIDVEGAEALVVRGALGVLERDRPVVTSELSLDMLRRVSGVSGEEYLALFTERGYSICVVDRAGGPPAALSSADELLSTWGDPYRIEDLLLLPG